MRPQPRTLPVRWSAEPAIGRVEVFAVERQRRAPAHGVGEVVAAAAGVVDTLPSAPMGLALQEAQLANERRVVGKRIAPRVNSGRTSR